MPERGRLRELIYRLRMGMPLRERPISDQDREPLRGEGAWGDPGHRGTGRANCGRPVKDSSK